MAMPALLDVEKLQIDLSVISLSSAPARRGGHKGEKEELRNACA